jgi:hypothetical protein
MTSQAYRGPTRNIADRLERKDTERRTDESRDFSKTNSSDSLVSSLTGSAPPSLHCLAENRTYQLKQDRIEELLRAFQNSIIKRIEPLTDQELSIMETEACCNELHKFFVRSEEKTGKDNETEIVNHFLIQSTPDLERDVNHSFALFEAA